MSNFLCYNEVMATTVPTEDAEQIAFVRWLDTQGIPYWHTNNEMWTKSWKQKTRSKQMGTKSGIPDLFLCFDGKLVGIEMKRQKGGVVSPTQKYWASILHSAGVEVFVCRGCAHAIETVETLLNSVEYKKMPMSEIKKAEELQKIAEKPKKSLKTPKNDCPF